MANHVGKHEDVEELPNCINSVENLLANEGKNNENENENQNQDMSLLLQRLDALETLVKEQHENFQTLAKALQILASGQGPEATSLGTARQPDEPRTPVVAASLLGNSNQQDSSLTRQVGVSLQPNGRQDAACGNPTVESGNCALKDLKLMLNDSKASPQEYPPVRSKIGTKARSPSILGRTSSQDQNQFDETALQREKKDENSLLVSTAERYRAPKDKSGLKQRKEAYASMAQSPSYVKHGNRQTSLAVEAARREVRRSEAQAVAQAMQRRSVLFLHVSIYS